MKLYIGDTHFGHANVIKHDQRPFLSVAEMDRELIKNWNSRVAKKDDIYIVGDFAYRNDKPVEWYLHQLNGRKHLIIGNHDQEILKSDSAMGYFETIDKMMHVTDDGNQICICHYPIIEWNGYYKGHYHIYAHIHNKKQETYEVMKTRERSLNAGCMINYFMPVTFKELVMNNQSFQMS